MSGSHETYYEILGIPSNASPQEISRAYRKLAKVLHPDVCNSPDADELFKAVNEAYQVLSNPERKARYDEGLEDHPSHQGTYYRRAHQYRDPRTWYYSAQYQDRTRHEQKKATPPVKKPTLPRIYQIVLFYLTLIMGVLIIAELFLIPWIDSVNTDEAMEAFKDGNGWMNEHEYQKAIDYYIIATGKLPTFTEAWRAKGMAEMSKADQLTALQNPNALKYYSDAIRSFGQVIRKEPNNPVILKNIGFAYYAQGEWEKAMKTLVKAKNLDPDDKQIAEKLSQATRRFNGFSS